MAVVTTPQPDNPSAAHIRMTVKWRAIRTVLAGTVAMRAAGKIYLPQHFKEPEENWNDRIKRAVLTNVLQDAVQGAVSRPFSKRVTFKDKAPTELKEWGSNIDLMGNSVHSFSRENFYNSVVDGEGYILVDHLPSSEGMSLADEAKAKLRPYMVEIPATRLLAAYWEKRDDRQVCTYARYVEDIVERDGFEEDIVRQVKELTPGKVVTWRKSSLGTWQIDPDQSGDVLFKRGVPLDRVPLFRVTTGNILGKTETTPPFLDLAHKNIEHWQVSSDYRNIVMKTCYPMLAVSGTDTPPATTEEGGAVVVGPDSLLRTSDPQGKWYYVQPDAAAFDTLHKDLEVMLNDMRMMGLDPIMPKAAGTVTATERAIDQAQSHTALKEWTLDYMDEFDEASAFMLRWAEGGKEVKVDENGFVSVNTDFQLALNDKDVDYLLKMYSLGMLSKPTVWEEVQRRGILSPTFDPDEEQEKLDAEPPSFDADGDGDPDPRPDVNPDRTDPDERTSQPRDRFN